ncbi:phospholipase A2 inhibitor CgMIP-I-like [Liasis olivaceus]
MQKRFLDNLSHGGIPRTMQPSLQIFFLFEFLRTVATLECEVCSDIGTNCTGNVKTCDDQQNTCFVILIHSTLEDTVLQTVAKGCESKEVCKTTKSHLNMGQGKILQASLICCTKDACKTARPQYGMLWDSAMKGCTTKSTCKSINRGQISILQGRHTVIITSRCSLATSKGVYLKKFFPLIFAGFLFLWTFF